MLEFFRTNRSVLWLIASAACWALGAVVSKRAADPALDLVAHGADGLDRLARRVVEFPVEVASAWDDRAGVAATHGDHHVGGTEDLIGPWMRGLAGDVDPHLPHRIYALPDGSALHLHGSGWRNVDLAAHYAHPRWTRVMAAAPDHLHIHGDDQDPTDLDLVGVDGGPLHLATGLPPDLDAPTNDDGSGGPTQVPAGMTDHPSQPRRQESHHRSARPTPNQPTQSRAAARHEEHLS